MGEVEVERATQQWHSTRKNGAARHNNSPVYVARYNTGRNGAARQDGKKRQEPEGEGKGDKMVE